MAILFIYAFSIYLHFFRNSSRRKTRAGCFTKLILRRLQFFWIVTLRRMVNCYWHFRGMVNCYWHFKGLYCLKIQDPVTVLQITSTSLPHNIRTTWQTGLTSARKLARQFATISPLLIFFEPKFRLKNAPIWTIYRYTWPTVTIILKRQSEN